MTGGASAYFRPGRTGLGNELFPWARRQEAAMEFGLELLPVNWRHLKRVGPYLRGERDRRRYETLFRDNPTASSLAALRARRGAQVLDESALPQALGGGRQVFTFSGMRGQFSELRRDPSWLRAELAAASARHRHREFVPRQTVGVHVRLGDFAPTPADPFSAPKNTRLPLSYYQDLMSALEDVDGGIQFDVFTDGAAEEVAPLLDGHQARLVRGLDTLDELLVMSECQLLIASGSTFSAWGAYLGGVPAIWTPPHYAKYAPKRDDRMDIAIAATDDLVLQLERCDLLPGSSRR